jgi:hypothetical protein
LFKRIEEKTLQALFMKYGGEKIMEKRKQQDGAKKEEAKAKKGVKPAKTK